MFSGNLEIKLESGHLRSGKIFLLGKRRRIATSGGSCSATEGEDYELLLHIDGGSCNEEEEYQLIFEEAEEEEAQDPGKYYDIPMNPCTSPQVISRNTSPSGFDNSTNNSSGTSSHGTPTSRIFNSIVPRVNIMAGNDIKLQIFNGNGLEDLEKHWFPCEALWTIQQVQDEAIKKA